MEKCRTYKDGSKRQHVFTSCRSRNLWDISFFSFLFEVQESHILFPLGCCITYCYCGARPKCQNKANGISIHVVLCSGAEIWSFRRLSGYELDGNEMFLRYASSGDSSGLNLSKKLKFAATPLPQNDNENEVSAF